MKREFYIDTPLGVLRVWAKHDVDNPRDFPGVFIDLVKPDGDEMLACVEYETCDDEIQTCVYNIGEDDPVAVIKQVTREDMT